MEKHELDEKVSEAFQSILSFCVSRTAHYNDAEDLAQDIIVEIYRSIVHIRDDRAFYGFMWSVAGNVYKQWCRKKGYRTTHEQIGLEDQKTEIPEDDSSDLYLLRRELMLLTQKYRQATILYYLEHQSCEQIADTLKISKSMVKYLLFKSRQILKEGIYVERNYGQQSFAPKQLKLMFLGEETDRYSHICDSKISQNILFACYNDRLTAEQISLEIGVSLPYMEEELDQLQKFSLIRKTGKKYETNIIIFTTEFNCEVEQKTAQFCDEIAGLIVRELHKKQEELRAVTFSGAAWNQNSFFWQMTCILLYHAIVEQLSETKKILYPTDSFGTHGFVWGQEMEKQSSLFDFGICELSDRQENVIRFMDFIVNGEMVHPYFFHHLHERNVFLEIACGINELYSENDRICAAEMVKLGYIREENGQMMVNVPVWTSKQLKEIQSILTPAAEQIREVAEQMLQVTARILKEHVPVYLEGMADNLAYTKVLEDAVSSPVRILCEQKFLFPSQNNSMLPTTYVKLK